ncbi:LLM class flavin-dependent oxidoreductase [Lichenicoccus roseus]|uniref:Luciferase-like monooxygenase n=1 Tax=Lichenicoccus roseus TaxID=2683649 RepID=A0A5R9J7N3_9PROT|nr:LLM class flavin-dependent oxidoreductase [Lichenicoccus roseus]TLU71631.1 LLM class flavin-dependent oxidoreductase [Lichenicoccus roseus]
MIPFSVLDLSPIIEGGDAALALRNTLDLARHAEALGYRRYWVAEHHNMPGIASAATAVVIAHVAGGTSRIRVGSGGIMLPNHAPLTIAEQFGTLAALHPGRIDLGLGRAPGSDQRTMLALRRDPGSADRFPNDVVELQSYFQPAVPGQAVQAVPGAGLDVPIWLLGSSLYSAQLAAMLGLPFAFASHFAPDLMDTAIELYRGRFEPSDALDKPHVMLGVNVFAADTGREARRLFTSAQQQFMMLRRGQPIKLQPPVDSMDELWSPMEAAGIMRSLSAAVVGDRLAVRDGIERFIEMHRPDELMVAAQIYDHEARRHSFEMVAELQRDHVLA